MSYHYMVELDYYNPELDEKYKVEDIENIIIAHFSISGKMVSISLSNLESIFWIILKVDVEEEIVELMNTIPIDFELSYDFFMLDHFEVEQEISSFSLN